MGFGYRASGFGYRASGVGYLASGVGKNPELAKAEARSPELFLLWLLLLLILGRSLVLALVFDGE
jgi:hypothetical protein